MQNNSEEMYKKSVLHVQSCFLPITPIAVFSPFSGVAFAALQYTLLYFVDWTMNIIESFAFSRG